MRTAAASELEARAKRAPGACRATRFDAVARRHVRHRIRRHAARGGPSAKLEPTGAASQAAEARSGEPRELGRRWGMSHRTFVESHLVWLGVAWYRPGPRETKPRPSSHNSVADTMTTMACSCAEHGRVADCAESNQIKSNYCIYGTRAWNDIHNLLGHNQRNCRHPLCTHELQHPTASSQPSILHTPRTARCPCAAIGSASRRQAGTSSIRSCTATRHT